MDDQDKIEVFRLYLTNIHPYGFRVGERAEIIGFKLAKPYGKHARYCYHVMYKDGETDFVPMSDNENFKIDHE